MNLTNIISAFLRIVSLIPLIIVLFSITKTFIYKLHSINGLRPYRVMMMGVLLAAIVDQMIFSYFDIKNMYSASGVLPIGSPLLLFNSLVTFLAYYFLYFLFRHASKKDKTDIFAPKGGKK